MSKYRNSVKVGYRNPYGCDYCKKNKQVVQLAKDWGIQGDYIYICPDCLRALCEMIGAGEAAIRAGDKNGS